MENYNDIPVVTAEPEKEGGKGFAIASLVLSICSFLPCCVPYIGGFASFVCGVLGIVFSLVSRSQNYGKFSTMAKAGLIISIIYFALMLLAVLAVVVFWVLYLVLGFSVAGFGILSEFMYY